MKTKKYLTTAEFARLCGTTKDALFLYDRMNILKPRLTGENGYRYYEPEQFFDYDLLMLTKQTGSTLKEIKGYLDEYGITDFLALFRQRLHTLDEQIERLTRMKHSMESVIAATEEGLAGPLHQPELVESEEEYLIVTPFRQENVSLDNYVNSLCDHYMYVESLPGVEKYPVGYVILKEKFLAGEYPESYVFSRAPFRIGSDRLVVKPAGKYVRLLVHMSDQQNPNYLDDAIRFIRENDLTVTGNLFEYDLITYFAQENIDEFVVKIMIPVV